MCAALRLVLRRRATKGTAGRVPAARAVSTVAYLQVGTGGVASASSPVCTSCTHAGVMDSMRNRALSAAADSRLDAPLPWDHIDTGLRWAEGV